MCMRLCVRVYLHVHMRVYVHMYVCECVFTQAQVSLCVQCVLGVGMRKHSWQPSRSLLQTCRTACRADGGGVRDRVLPAPTIYPAALPLLHQPLDSGPRYPRPAPELGSPQQQRHGSQGVSPRAWVTRSPSPQPPAVRLQGEVAAAPSASISPFAKWGQPEHHPHREAVRTKNAHAGRRDHPGAGPAPEDGGVCRPGAPLPCHLEPVLGCVLVQTPGTCHWDLIRVSAAGIRM